MKLTAKQANTYKAMIEGRETFKNQYNRMEWNKAYNIRLNRTMLDELEWIYCECEYNSADENELLYDIFKHYNLSKDEIDL